MKRQNSVEPAISVLGIAQTDQAAPNAGLNSPAAAPEVAGRQVGTFRQAAGWWLTQAERPSACFAWTELSMRTKTPARTTTEKLPPESRT